MRVLTSWPSRLRCPKPSREGAGKELLSFRHINKLFTIENVLDMAFTRFKICLFNLTVQERTPRGEINSLCFQDVMCKSYSVLYFIMLHTFHL